VRDESNEGWALVLGVSAGTGAAGAEALAADPGLNIFGVHRGRHDPTAGGVREAVEAAGRTAHFIHHDAAKPERIADGVTQIRETIPPGRLRVIIHAMASSSVGVFTGKDALEPWKYAKSFAVMAHSYAWWAQALLETDLCAPAVRLVGFTNPLTTTPLHPCGLIAATKGALEIYVRYLALETKGRMRTSLVNFSAADTRASNIAVPNFNRAREVFASATPAGRLVDVAEVGRLVSFIASDAGAWFNGAVIDFTGGEPWSYRSAAVHEDE